MGAIAALTFVILSISREISAGPLSEPILPLPKQAGKLSDRADLGRQLFHDVRLSKDNTISCASCHNLTSGGADNKAFSIGIKGAVGGINSPTVFNSGFNFRQFWNGRARTLEDQVEGPVNHPKEMGSNWDEVLAKLKKDLRYVKLFQSAFPDGLTRKNIKSAIADFERNLVTSGSRFDKFLNGDHSALNKNELRGYGLFKSYGCISCHQGMNVGGNMYQTMGVMGDYFKDRGKVISEADLGRFSITKNPRDKFVFRVPSLRNVELTAPYFHDGSARSLVEAIKVMGKYQLGRKISDRDAFAIRDFLITLTGELPTFVRELQSKGD